MLLSCSWTVIALGCWSKFTNTGNMHVEHMQIAESPSKFPQTAPCFRTLDANVNCPSAPPKAARPLIDVHPNTVTQYQPQSPGPESNARCVQRPWNSLRPIHQMIQSIPDHHRRPPGIDQCFHFQALFGFTFRSREPLSRFHRYHDHQRSRLKNQKNLPKGNGSAWGSLCCDGENRFVISNEPLSIGIQ